MKFSYSKYTWLGYPVIVAILILFSVNYLVGGQNQAWFKLLEKQQQISKDREAVGIMKAKIATLKQTNVNQVREDLGLMLTAVPDKSPIQAMVNVLRYGAAESGSTLDKYKSSSISEGQIVLIADYVVPDFPSVEKLLKTLESSLPLVKIISANYLAPDLTITVAFADIPQDPISVKISDPLPSYYEPYSQLKTVLANYQLPTVEVAASASVSSEPISTDPFGPLPGSN